MECNLSIIESMTILTTAIDRAPDLRTVIRTRGSNHHIGIIDPCQFIVDRIRSTHITTRRSENHTVLITIRTDSTAIDINLGCTGIHLSSSFGCSFPSSRHI